MTEVYLARWLWNIDDPTTPHWSAPGTGSVGCLDLRSIPQCAAPGPVAQGWGIFTYPTAQVISGALALGSNLDRILTNPQKNTIRNQLGLPSALSANTLVDALWEVLTTQADPTGLLRCKPLMPTVRGNLELHLGGFSLIKSKPFAFGELEGPVVRAALQEQYRRLRQEYPSDVYRQVLGGWCRKYRTTNYQLFLPDGVPDEGWLPPHTTITDNFNRADADALGTSAEGWSWTETLSDIDIVSNAAAGGGAATQRDARAESSLSTDDHTTQGDCADGEVGGNDVGVLTRFLSTDRTFYWGFHQNGASLTYRIFKMEAGTATALGSLSDTAPGSGAILDKLSSDGSTQEFTSGGTVRVTVTDTAITANLRTGIKLRASAQTIDNFQAADITVAAGHPTMRRWGHVTHMATSAPRFAGIR